MVNIPYAPDDRNMRPANYTSPILPPSPFLTDAQALVRALDLLAQPEQQAPNTYGDIINGLRGNRVAAMYQNLIAQGVDPAQAQAAIRQMATWLGAAQAGGPAGLRALQAAAPSTKQAAPTTPVTPATPGEPVPRPLPIGIPVGPGTRPGGWGGPGGVNPGNMRTGFPGEQYTQVPTGNDLYSRVPTGNFAAQQARLRQLLGLSPVATAIQSKLRGG